MDLYKLILSSDEDIESYVRDLCREEGEYVLVLNGVIETELYIEAEIYRLKLIRQGTINAN